MLNPILALTIAFAVSVILGPIVIPVLRRLKIGQTVRTDGPETHLKKSGTPTMGGVIILAGFLVGTLVFYKEYERTLPILFLSVGFGIVGFIDDFIKVVLKRSLGLRAWQKMGLQFLITGAFAAYLYFKMPECYNLLVPFGNGGEIVLSTLPFVSIPLLFLVVLGTDNGSNFTDGLDGLAGKVTSVIAVFFAVAAIMKGDGTAVASAAMLGGLLGFLLFNTYPAKVFMGDTGSLALGGYVAAQAYLLKMPLFIPIIAFVYLAEVVSVMLQVGYFKISHGKRIFKMAPIHHHFEKCGYPETKVVTAFTIVTILLCIAALLAI
ncbi:MAG: phospho-N-acetylmuramoyl-pentapeptide-transferase [Lachnospiraceae bacterium]|nr:phospho-N-acetylmuramoyl-pentapeptide-transferase [Lachnospiraceae bacterium]